MSKSDRPTAAISPELDAAFKALLNLPYTEMSEFEAKLAKARREASEKALAERRAAHPKEWRYTASVITDNWQEVRPCSGVVQIRIRGEVTNQAELLQHGYTQDELSGGSMIYLFNAENGKFIGSSGGGNIYIKGSGGGSFGRNDELRKNADLVYTQIEELIRSEGGTDWDITSIIRAQPDFKSF